MEFIKKYSKWFILSILIFIFVLVTRELLKSELSEFDNLIYTFISDFRNPILTEIFKTISFFSSAIFLVILSLCLFFLFKNKKYGILSLCNLIFIVGINQLLKLIFSRPRPFEWMIVSETGYSFPSGHAMVSTAFYGMLIYLIWQTDLDKKFKKLWTAILITLVLFIGISRIYLGVHYASDIIAGFTLSLSYLIISTSMISYYLKYRRSIKKEKTNE